MPARVWMIMALLAACLNVSACGALIGAGGAVAADEAAEEDNGDDGLF